MKLMYTGLTSCLSINIRDRTLDNRRIQESFVCNPETLVRLVLLTFTLFPRRFDRLERGSRDSIIRDPIGPITP